MLFSGWDSSLFNYTWGRPSKPMLKQPNWRRLQTLTKTDSAESGVETSHNCE